MTRAFLQTKGIGRFARSAGSASGCRAPVHRSAFSLLELLIALALLVLLAAFAWPMLENQIGAMAMPESAARMRDTLFLARAEAMQQHRRVRVRFAPNEQQPFIEIEKDPMSEPGVWAPVTTTWVKELPLIEDVQVHTIENGRPAYLKPIAFDESTDEAQEDSEEQEEQENTEDFDATMPSATSINEDVQLDENRPIILFEPDGGSDWATIKLTKADLDVELTEEDFQLWVVLDGRTGLAYIRDQVTEAQLSDETFYVKRENLELPKEQGTDDLAYGVQDPNAAAAEEDGGGKFGGPSGSFGGGGQGGLPNGALGPGDLAGLPDNIKDQLPGGGNGMGGGGKNGGRGPNGGPGGEGKGPGGNQGGGRGPDAPGPKGQGGGKNDDTGGGKGGQPRDGADDLGNDLNDSDLTDEEQDNISDALNNNSNSNSNINSNGNANQNSNSNSNLNDNSNSNSNNTNKNLNANDNSNNNNSNKP